MQVMMQYMSANMACRRRRTGRSFTERFKRNESSYLPIPTLVLYLPRGKKQSRPSFSFAAALSESRKLR